MRFPDSLVPGSFVSRPNRFLTVVDVRGRPVEAHLPDPGRLRELLVPGRRVWLVPASGPRRKTRFTLLLVEAPTGALVSLITTLPNELVAEGLASGAIGELAGWRAVEREVRWGRSRFDFLLSRGRDERMLLEVKSVTLVDDRRALFPDAVTARGARHVRELAEARSAGLEAAVLFVVQRADADGVSPARAIDARFAAALDHARRLGVRTLAYRCAVSRRGARLDRPVPVLLDPA